MKQIKLFIFAALAFIAGTTMTSCTDYQDEIDALDKRVYRLENLVDSINQNLDGLQTFINAAAEGWIVTGMAELPEGNGYMINFGKLDPETGEISDKPEDKKTVVVRNGRDAEAPNIRLKQDPSDGNYYWVIDGEWLKGPNGDRIRVNGKDGKDGEDGTSTAPKLSIDDDGYWIMSTDGGLTWFRVLDSNNKPVKAEAKDGEDGQPGENAKIIITNVRIDVDSDGNRFITFTLKGAGGNGEDIDVRTLIMN